MKNAQRQEACSISQPPRTGPTAAVMAVNPDQIRQAARRIIDENNIAITVVGDASKIKHDLGFFAPVEVYDTSGKLSSTPEKVDVH